MGSLCICFLESTQYSDEIEILRGASSTNLSLSDKTLEPTFEPIVFLYSMVSPISPPTGIIKKTKSNFYQVIFIKNKNNCYNKNKYVLFRLV